MGEMKAAIEGRSKKSGLKKKAGKWVMESGSKTLLKKN